jgi:hypothetical protein
MSICNGIAYTYNDGHVDYIVDERFSGTPLVGPVEAPPFSAQEVIPPQDHERLELEAVQVIQKTNGLHNRNFEALFQNIDSLQGIFNQLKPIEDPVFSFQRDDQDGGMIYWQGRYRKWFYLLYNKRVGSVPEKVYLNLLYPGKKSSDMKRKFWVAMDCDLRNKVVAGEMTLTEAMDAASKK